MSTLSLTSTLDGGVCSTKRPSHFASGNETVPIVQEAGWAPGPAGMGMKNLAATRIRSPDHLARNYSPYRLSYSGPHG